MTGTVKPEEQIVATGNIMDLKEEEKVREQQEAMQRQREQMEALAKLQEDQKARLEREEMIRIQQEKLAKLAPWAKKENSPVKEAGQGMTLQEIQEWRLKEREKKDNREIFKKLSSEKNKERWKRKREPDVLLRRSIGPLLHRAVVKSKVWQKFRQKRRELKKRGLREKMRLVQ